MENLGFESTLFMLLDTISNKHKLGEMFKCRHSSFVGFHEVLNITQGKKAFGDFFKDVLEKLASS